jgi:glycosyltransferase involved in cell wall biosynthesis
VFSGFGMYSKTGERSSEDEEYGELYGRIHNHPQMKHYGSVSNDELREHIQNMHILTYPSNFQETSCIVAIEAMSGGCLAVVPDSCALHETCDNYGIMYDFIPNEEDHINYFVDILHETVDKYWSEETQELLQSQVDHFHRFYDIDDRVDEWTNLIEGILEENG